VEIDTTAPGSRDHIRRLRSADRASWHISYIVDPSTGQIRGTRLYDPSTRRTRLYRSQRSLPAPRTRSGPGMPPLPPVITFDNRTGARSRTTRRTAREFELANFLF
jgi:hypothetical protein